MGTILVISASLVAGFVLLSLYRHARYMRVDGIIKDVTAEGGFEFVTLWYSIEYCVEDAKLTAKVVRSPFAKAHAVGARVPLLVPRNAPQNAYIREEWSELFIIFVVAGAVALTALWMLHV